MIPTPTYYDLDDMLRLYHTFGRRKRERVLDLISEFVPHDKVTHMIDRNKAKGLI